MSWRVAILPQLEHTGLFEAYDPQQPWNSPKNREATDVLLKTYRCPSDPKGAGSHETSYVMLVGRGTVAGLPEKDRNLKYIDAHSGAASTIFVIEASASGIQWAEPRDLTVDEFIERIRSHKGGNHRGVIAAAFCDGHVDFIRDDISADTLRALANPNRDKPVDEKLWKLPGR